MALITPMCPAGTVNVTFRVNVRVKILKGTFNPATEIVRVVGGFNNWQNDPPFDTLTSSTNDSIFFKTVQVPADSSFLYKYLRIAADQSLDWEGIDNRSLTTGSGDTTLAVA